MAKRHVILCLIVTFFSFYKIYFQIYKNKPERQENLSPLLQSLGSKRFQIQLINLNDGTQQDSTLLVGSKPQPDSKSWKLTDKNVSRICWEL